MHSLRSSVALALATTLCLPVAAAPTIGSCPVFPANNIFNTRIDKLPVHADSAAFIKRIGANYSGSTYTGSTAKLVHLDMGMQASMAPMDTYYGIPYNVVNTTTTPSLWKRVLYVYNGVEPDVGYPDESDCAVQTSPGVFTSLYPCTPAAGTFTYMPILPIGTATGGAGELKIEGGVPSTSAAGDPDDPANAYNEYGDHHILSIDTATCTLWEAYHAYPQNGSASASIWEVFSTARFDLNSNVLRENGATSADAAGFPIFPLLMRADEANAGPDGIQHALRFTIQNSKVRGTYNWPARHLTGSNPADGTPGDDGLRPAMGQLFRLPANFDITTVSGWPAGQVPHAQTVAIVNALKRYGMYIADNGSNMYIQGEPSAAWASQTFSQLQRIPSTAFEAVDLTPFMTRPGFNVNSAAVPSPVQTDFNADNRSDLLWRHTPSGSTYVWYMNGVSLISDQLVTTVDPSWKMDGIADFNGDGHPDIVWRNGAGNTYVWYLVNGVFQSDAFLFSLPPEWVIQGVADFNADGKPDFLMRNTNSGNAFAWFFNNNVAIGDQFLFNIDPSWKVEGVGDFNADGQPDLLFRNMGSGLAFAWNTQYAAGNLSLTTSSPSIFSIDPTWEVVQVADWNNDGHRDLLFRNRDTGVVFVWYMNGTTLTTSDFIIQIDPVWEIVPRR